MFSEVGLVTRQMPRTLKGVWEVGSHLQAGVAGRGGNGLEGETPAPAAFTQRITTLGKPSFLDPCLELLCQIPGGQILKARVWCGL